MPHIELSLAPTGEDLQEMALALMRAIIAAADQDKDEMTVLRRRRPRRPRFPPRHGITAAARPVADARWQFLPVRSLDVQ